MELMTEECSVLCSHTWVTLSELLHESIHGSIASDDNDEVESIIIIIQRHNSIVHLKKEIKESY